MEAEQPKHVEQSEVVLHRKDIVKYLGKHRQMYESIKGDISLISQSYSKVGHQEYVNIILSYLDCVDVCLDLLDYVQDCMTVGIEGAKQERGQRIDQKGGD